MNALINIFVFFSLSKQLVLRNRHFVARNTIKCWALAGSITVVAPIAKAEMIQKWTDMQCHTYIIHQVILIVFHQHIHYSGLPILSKICRAIERVDLDLVPYMYFTIALSLLIPCAESMFPPACSPNLYASVTAKPIYYQMLWESTHFLFLFSEKVDTFESSLFWEIHFAGSLRSR